MDGEDDQRKKKFGNTVQTWGNATTMNINSLVYTNILSSPYFKNSLFKLKTYHEAVDEIYYKVDHLEPWEKGSRKTSGQVGMCGGVRGVGAGGIVSSCYCLLFKLFTLKLTRKQLKGLLDHPDSPYIRGIGFMYVRYCLQPKDIWSWIEPYLEDEEEIDVKAGSGCIMTIGQLVRSFVLKLEWYGTLFPRIPVPVEKDIRECLTELNLCDDHKIKADEGWGEAERFAKSTRERSADGRSNDETGFGEAERYSKVRRMTSSSHRHSSSRRSRSRDRSRERSNRRSRSVDRVRERHRQGRRSRSRDRSRERKDRRSRDRSKERQTKRSRSRDGSRDRNKPVRSRDRSKERRDRRTRDRSKERQTIRSTSRERSRERNRPVKRSRSRDRSRERKDRREKQSRERSREKQATRRSRDRSRDRHAPVRRTRSIDRSRERKDRRSRDRSKEKQTKRSTSRDRSGERIVSEIRGRSREDQAERYKSYENADNRYDRRGNSVGNVIDAYEITHNEERRPDDYSTQDAKSRNETDDPYQLEERGENVSSLSITGDENSKNKEKKHSKKDKKHKKKKSKKKHKEKKGDNCDTD